MEFKEDDLASFLWNKMLVYKKMMIAQKLMLQSIVGWWEDFVSDSYPPIYFFCEPAQPVFKQASKNSYGCCYSSLALCKNYIRSRIVLAFKWGELIVMLVG